MTVETSTDATPHHAMVVIAPIDLTSVFHGLGPLPAVVAVNEQTGAWDEPGQSRVLELGDGTRARETLTAYDAPGHFAYRVDAFTGALRFLIDGVDGAWWFAPRDGGGTDIRWTYAFCPKPARRVAVALLIAPLWRIYARRTLALMLDAVAERARGA